MHLCIKLFCSEMKIAIIGSRGIPARYGGFETFSEKISSILSKGGHDVTVIGEKGNANNIEQLGKVKVRESVFRKSKNPILFYWDSFYKSRRGFDVSLYAE